MFPVKDEYIKNVKYAARSKARVLDNRDPLKKGRIKVKNPLIGDSNWIPYLRTPSGFDVPKINDIVYIESDCGFAEYPIAWGNITTGEDSSPDIPEEFRRDIPTNRGLFTPNGHLVELDDGEATATSDPDDTQYTTTNRGIRITTTAGNKIHIAEDEDGGQQFILLEDAGGNFFKMDYKENIVSLNAVDKETITITGDKTETIGGKETVDVTGDRTETVGGDETITTTGDRTHDAANHNITSSGDIKFGSTGASENLVLGVAFQTLYNAHSHIGNLGIATGPPLVPMSATELASKHFTEL